LIVGGRPLKPEDIAVLERISSDLERDGLLAGALGQWHLASEINAALTATRQVIADLAEDPFPAGHVRMRRYNNLYQIRFGRGIPDRLQCADAPETGEGLSRTVPVYCV